MPIFAILNLYISGRVQPSLTKFGNLIEPPKLHFRLKRDGIEQASVAQ